MLLLLVLPPLSLLKERAPRLHQVLVIVMSIGIAATGSAWAISRGIRDWGN
jgi:hypothetical protein